MKFLITTFGFILGLSFAHASSAGTETAASAADATVIVYRTDASVRSRGVKFDVRAEQKNQGRIAAGEAIVITSEPGAFTLSSSLPGTPSLELDLKPGQVHYVEYDLAVRNSRSKLELREVGEQVAKVHIDELPELTI